MAAHTTVPYPTPSPSPAPPNPRLSRKPAFPTLTTNMAALAASEKKKAKKQNKEELKKTLRCVPPTPTTRMYMGKALPPVPGPAPTCTAPTRPAPAAPLAPISKNKGAASVGPLPETLAPTSRSKPSDIPSKKKDEKEETSTRPRPARYATGSSEAMSWRLDTPHPLKSQQNAGDYLMEKRLKRAMRDRQEALDLVCLAIALSATQNW